MKEREEEEQKQIRCVRVSPACVSCVLRSVRRGEQWKSANPSHRAGGAGNEVNALRTLQLARSLVPHPIPSEGVDGHRKNASRQASFLGGGCWKKVCCERQKQKDFED